MGGGWREVTGSVGGGLDYAGEKRAGWVARCGGGARAAKRSSNGMCARRASHSMPSASTAPHAHTPASMNANLEVELVLKHVDDVDDVGMVDCEEQVDLAAQVVGALHLDLLDRLQRVPVV